MAMLHQSKSELVIPQHNIEHFLSTWVVFLERCGNYSSSIRFVVDDIPGAKLCVYSSNIAFHDSLRDVAQQTKVTSLHDDVAIPRIVIVHDDLNDHSVQPVGNGRIVCIVNSTLTRVRMLLDERVPHTRHWNLEELQNCFARLLNANDDDIQASELTMVGQNELDMFSKWNAKDEVVQAELIHRMFEARARRSPDASAVVGPEGDEVTYRQLNNLANHYAAALVEKGVTPDSFVSIYMERSIAYVVATLAVLKSGGAFVPIDVTYPTARVATIIKESGSKLLLTNRHPSNDQLDFSQDIAIETIQIETNASVVGETKNPRVSVEMNHLSYMLFTSGSTGVPKGVELEHHCFTATVVETAKKIGLCKTDKVLQFFNLSFDVSITEIYTTLITGAVLVLRGEDWLQSMQQHKITVAYFTPTALSTSIHPSQVPTLRIISVAGEPCTDDLISAWCKAGITLFNGYGPTETTACSWTEMHLHQPTNIGSAFPGMSFHVVDPKSMQLQPIGVIGELLVGGQGLARGYHNKPEQTKKAFLTNVLGVPRLYRTGDLVSWTREGVLVYHGRKDQQIKLRGFRIELGEVAAAFTAQSSVKTATCTKREDSPFSPYLAAYVVPVNDGQLDESAVLSAANAALPNYMRVSTVTLLPAIPTTSNGKVDFSKLPVPFPHPGLAENEEDAFVPQTLAENVILQAIKQVLGTHVGGSKTFFEYGGDSMLSIALVAVCRQQGVIFTPNDVQVHQTVVAIAKVATHVTEVNETSSSEQITVHSELRDSIPDWYAPDNVQLVLKTTPLQAGMIAASLQSKSAYTLINHFSLKGYVGDFERITQSFQHMIHCHPLLRTSFTLSHEHGPLQVIVKELDELPLSKLDQPPKLNQLLHEGFDLELRHQALHRLFVWKDQVTGMIQVGWKFHHGIVDGISIDLLTDAFCTTLQWLTQSNQSLLGSPITSNLITWQHVVQHTVDISKLSEAESFWRDQLSGFEVPTKLQLRPSEVPPGATSSFDSATHVLSDEDSSLLRQFAVKQNQTLSTLFTAAWTIALSQFSNQLDVCFGVTVSGRMLPLEGIEKLIAPTINTIPLRTPLHSDTSALDLMQMISVFHNEAAGYEHSALVDIKRWSDLSDAHQSLFETSFASQFVTLSSPNTMSDNIVVAKDVKIMDNPELDLNCSAGFCSDSDSSTNLLEVTLTYNRNKYLNEDIQHLLGAVVLAVKTIMSNVNGKVKDYNLSPAYWTQRLSIWNSTFKDWGPGRNIPVQDLIANVAQNLPGKVAVEEHNGRTITYEQLDHQSNWVAQELIRVGVTFDNFVMICVPKSAAYISAVLGVLKAGAAFVPIEPESGEQRIRFVLDDCKPAAAIMMQGKMSELFQSQHVVCLDPSHPKTLTNFAKPTVSMNQLCYAIYTSGTTGRPKGVEIEHRSLTNLALTTRKLLEISTDDKVLAFASTVFDASIGDIFPCLIAGATLVVPELDYVEAIKQLQVSVASMTPSSLAAMVPEQVPTLTRLLVGAEACPDHVVQTWCVNGRRLFNGYGPTETTVDASATELFPGETVSVGGPHPNVQFYVVNPSTLALCPPHVAGELLIGGIGVARQYHNLTKETENAFIKFQEKHFVYRTGDLVRWLPSGKIQHLGRIDSQVKIRGFRIELEAIESLLVQQHGIRAAVCRKWDSDEEGPERLVGYYVLEREAFDSNTVHKDLDYSNTLHEALLQVLPQYSVPEQFIPIDHISQTNNGKIDRNQLPKPARVKSNDGEGSIPRTETEMKLYDIVLQLIPQNSLNVDVSLFQQGLDSIMLIRFVSMSKQQGIPLSAPDVYKYKTITELSAFICRTNTTIPDFEISGATQGTVEGVVSLTPIQRWFFDEFKPKNQNHYNQSQMFELPKGTSVSNVRNALRTMLQHHDMLRATYTCVDQVWQQELTNDKVIPDTVLLQNVSDEPVTTSNTSEVMQVCQQLQRSLNIELGHLVSGCVIHNSRESHMHLVLVIHHLVVDAVSWLIIQEDLYTVLQGNKLPLKTTSFAHWAAQQKQSVVPLIETTLKWPKLQSTPRPIAHLKCDYDPRCSVVSNTESITVQFDTETSFNLVASIHQTLRTNINDVLIAALGLAYQDWCGRNTLFIDLEGHGREVLDATQDIGRTVGWFTSVFPVEVHVPVKGTSENEVVEAVCNVKEHLRNIPNKGYPFGVAKYLGDGKGIPKQLLDFCSQVSFNYLGKVNDTLNPAASLDIAAENPATHALDINGMTVGDMLQFEWTFQRDAFTKEVSEFARLWKDRLVEVSKVLQNHKLHRLTPSDLSHISEPEKVLKISQEVFGIPVTEIADIYPATPLQVGMLLSTSANASAYVSVLCMTVHGKDINGEKVAKAMSLLAEQHPILRTGFLLSQIDQPAQVVLKHSNVRVEELHIPPNSEEEWVAEQQEIGFRLWDVPLLRCFTWKISPSATRIAIVDHHSVIDGFSSPLLCEALLSKLSTIHSSIPRAESKVWRNFIDFVQDKRSQSREYWKSELAGFQAPSVFLLPEPKHPVSGICRTIQFKTKSTASTFEALARASDTTPASILKAAWALVVSTYSTEQDVLFGTVVSGRNANVDGIETMIGPALNTIPLRVLFREGFTGRDLIEIVAKKHEECIPHEHESLMDMQQLSDVAPGTALFDSLFLFENHGEVAVDGNLVTDVRTYENPEANLMCTVAPGTHMTITLTYDGAKFSAQDANDIAESMRLAADALVQNPNQVVRTISLTSQETLEVISTWNNTHHDWQSRNRPVYELVSETAKSNPFQIALIDPSGEKMSYKDLDHCSNVLAQELVARGAREDVFIGILLERSIDYVVSILAVMKSGAAYVPISTEYPMNRIKYILKDSATSVLLMNSKSKVPDTYEGDFVMVNHSNLLNKRVVETLDAPKLSLSQLCYLLYTSGTTGTPKGVEIEHGSLTNLVHCNIEAWEMSPNDVYLQFFNVSFDTSQCEIYSTLVVGATLVLRSDDWVKTIQEHGVTCAMFTPAALKASMTPEDVPLVHKVSVGADTLPESVVREWCGAGRRVFNFYGPTECTINSSTVELFANETINIGGPFPNFEYYVVDPVTLKQLPIGVPGELLIGGAGLARQYHNLPHLTAKAFIPNPFTPGQRLYRTGDLVRWLRSGKVEHLGRMDHQVKLRGFRIELGEIETLLGKQPGVKAAYCLKREEVAGNPYLAAYVVGHDGKQLDLDQLREATKLLPSYMIPSVLVPMNALPRNANGKVDRRALPVPQQSANVQQREPLTSESERIVAKAMCTVLGIEDEESIGANTDFFQAGANSLQVIRLISQIQRDTQVQLKVPDVFSLRTVGAIASQLDIHRTQMGNGAMCTSTQALTVQPRSGIADFPVTANQKRMFVTEMIDPGAPVYNMPNAYWVKGVTSAKQVARAIQATQQRFEILRTTYFMNENGEVRQRINPSAEEFHPEVASDVVLRSTMQHDMNVGFDITQSVFRARVLVVGNDIALVICIHHIAADGESMQPILETFEAFLQHGIDTPMPVIPQVVDLAIWELETKQAKLNVSYFKELLYGAPRLLQLPIDKPRPSKLTHTGKSISSVTMKGSRNAVRRLAQSCGSSEYSVLLSAVGVLLGRHSNQSDVVLGTLQANRALAGTEDLVGFLVNTLVTRVQFDDSPEFQELVRDVGEITQEVLERQNTPFQDIVEVCDPHPRPANRSPLFQTLVVLQNGSENGALNDSKVLDVIPTEDEFPVAKFELSITFTPSNTEDEYYDVLWVYNTDLFDKSTVECVSKRFMRFFEEVLREPKQRVDRVPFLLPEDYDNLDHWSKAFSDGNKATSHITNALSKHDPTSVAMVCKESQTTFGKLERKTNKLANVLLGKKLHAEQVAIVYCDLNSIQAITAVFAVLKAGGKLMMLDSKSHSIEQVDHLIEVSGAKFLLVSKETSSLKSTTNVHVVRIDKGLKDASATLSEASTYHDMQTAFVDVNFANGSVNSLRGVEYTFGALHKAFSTFPWSVEGNDTSTVSIVMSNLSHGFAIICAMSALYYGCTLESVTRKPDAIVVSRDHVPNVLHQHGSNAPQIIAVSNLSSSSESVIADGLDAHQVERILVTYVIPEVAGILLSDDFSHQPCFIVDPCTLEQVAPQTVGELVIGHGALCQRYFNNGGEPSKFVSVPFKDEGAFRTGFLAEWRHGKLHVIGHKSKVVVGEMVGNLDDISSQLSKLPGVLDGVCINHGQENNPQLIGYVVPTSERIEINTTHLLSLLADVLPSEFVPSSLVVLMDIPRTKRGVVKVASLPIPFQVTTKNVNIVPPTTTVQKSLCKLLSELLEQPESQIGIKQSFFELGGDSMLVIRFVALARQQGLAITANQVYTYGDVETLSRICESLTVPETRDVGAVPVHKGCKLLLPVNREEFDAETYEKSLSNAGLDISTLSALALPTPLQTGMVLATKRDRSAYTSVMTWTLEGDHVSTKKVKSGFQRLAKKHPVLRASFLLEDQQTPLQVIHRKVSIPMKELKTVPKSESEWIQHQCSRGFDVEHSPLFRVRTWRIESNKLRVAFVYHHALIDGFSQSILLKSLMEELILLDSAITSGARKQNGSNVQELETANHSLPEPSEEQTWYNFLLYLNTRSKEECELFWKNHLKEASRTVLQVPKQDTIDALPRVDISRSSSNVSLTMLREYAQRHSTTLANVCGAAWGIVLSRFSNQNDVMFGNTVSGRNANVPFVESMVGPALNTVPVRVQFEDHTTGEELVLQYSNNRNNSIPFEYASLMDVKQACGNSMETELFESVFVFENFPDVEPSQEKVQAMQIRDIDGDATTDLSILCFGLPDPSNDEINFEIRVSNSTKYVEGTAQQLACALAKAVDCLVQQSKHDLSSYCIVSNETVEEFRNMNETYRDWATNNRPVPELVVQTCKKQPNQIAIIDRYGNKITYKDLDVRTQKVAMWLCGQGISSDQFIGILVDRSIDFVVAALGVLRSGAAYVPISPMYPDSRISYILQDAGVKALLVHDGTLSRFSTSTDFQILNVSDTIHESITGQLPSLSLSDLSHMVYTSGSTGQPKGVELEHRNMLATILGTIDAMELNTKDRVLQFFNVSFDVSVTEIFATLVVGGTLVLRGEDWVETINKYKVTAACFTPTALDATMKPDLVPTLSKVVVTGEPCSDKIKDAWIHAGRRVFNGYGPTETTACSWAELSLRTVHIGVPLPNMYFAIVHPSTFQLTPKGVPGELLIGGEGLARAYHDDIDRTTKSFVTVDEWETSPAPTCKRWYRSGDLVRLASDGVVEYIGRIDQQVKLRGFRIELGEISNVLVNCLGVQHAVCTKRNDDGDYLAAYVVAEPDHEISPEKIIEEASDFLPAYMIPRVVVVLKQLPRTANGKVDIGNLPPPVFDVKIHSSNSGKLVTETERIVARSIEMVLRLAPGTCNNDDFFSFGGNSLDVLRLVGVLHEQTKVRVPLSDIFVLRTVSAIAHAIDQTMPSPESMDDIAIVKQPRIPNDFGECVFPTTFNQERLFTTEMIQPGAPTYNLPFAFWIPAPANKVADAVRKLQQNHEVLRTVYRLEVQNVLQVVLPSHSVLSPKIERVTEEQLQEALREDYETGFDISRAVFRSKVFQVEHSERCALLLCAHHIAIDGESMPHLIADLEKLVVGKPTSDQENSIQCADLATWERSYYDQERIEQELAYFEMLYMDAPRVLEFPFDYHRRAQLRFVGNTVVQYLSVGTFANMRTLALKLQVSDYAILTAAMGVVLGRHSNQKDVLLGSIQANRTKPGLENFVGFIANTVAMRVNFTSSPSFQDLVKSTGKSIMETLDRQSLPFNIVVDKCDPDRDASRSALFQVVLVLQNGSDINSEQDGLLEEFSYSDSDGSNVAKYELTVIATPLENGELLLRWKYNTDLFKESTVLAISERFSCFLEHSIETPNLRVDEINMITVNDQTQLDAWSFGKEREMGNQTVLKLFQQQAESLPNHVAVVDASTSDTLTYGELNNQSRVLAASLTKQGVTRGDLVALFIERSTEFIVSIIAVLRIGAAYVPIDPTTPNDRVQFILNDSGCKGVLTSINHELPETIVYNGLKLNVSQLDLNIQPEQVSLLPHDKTNLQDPCYHIYTSGTTGTPKGVVVRHCGIMNTVLCFTETIGVTSQSTFLQGMNIAFDASVLEIFTALVNGASLVLRNNDFVDSIVRYNVTHVLITPSIANAFLVPADVASLEVVVLGGESVNPKLLEDWADSGVKLFNSYGPTEISVASSTVQLRHHELVTIGSPFANVSYHIVQPHSMVRVPVGVPGELLIGGVGVAVGYHNLPEKTATVFVDDPFSASQSKKLYRTGDLVRWTPGGTVQFLGRLDHQVKIRGFRIELGEIESALMKITGLKDAVCVKRGTIEPYLAAYYVEEDQSSLSHVEIQTNLVACLPAYMVPAAIVKVHAIPRTSNGKVDTAKLPAPSLSTFTTSAYEEPNSITEKQVADAFQLVLGMDKVSALDDFYNLGGDSLRVTRLSKLLNLAVSHLTRLRTVRSIASYLDMEHHSTVHDIQGERDISFVPPPHELCSQSLVRFSIILDDCSLEEAIDATLWMVQQVEALSFTGELANTQVGTDVVLQGVQVEHLVESVDVHDYITNMSLEGNSSSGLNWKCSCVYFDGKVNLCWVSRPSVFDWHSVAPFVKTLQKRIRQRGRVVGGVRNAFYDPSVGVIRNVVEHFQPQLDEVLLSRKSLLPVDHETAEFKPSGMGMLCRRIDLTNVTQIADEYKCTVDSVLGSALGAVLSCWAGCDQLIGCMSLEKRITPTLQDAIGGFNSVVLHKAKSSTDGYHLNDHWAELVEQWKKDERIGSLASPTQIMQARNLIERGSSLYDVLVVWLPRSFRKLGCMLAMEHIDPTVNIQVLFDEMESTISWTYNAAVYDVATIELLHENFESALNGEEIKHTRLMSQVTTTQSTVPSAIPDVWQRWKSVIQDGRNACIRTATGRIIRNQDFLEDLSNPHLLGVSQYSVLVQQILKVVAPSASEKSPKKRGHNSVVPSSGLFAQFASQDRQTKFQFTQSDPEWTLEALNQAIQNWCDLIKLRPGDTLMIAPGDCLSVGNQVALSIAVLSLGGVLLLDQCRWKQACAAGEVTLCVGDATELHNLKASSVSHTKMKVLHVYESSRSESLVLRDLSSFVMTHPLVLGPVGVVDLSTNEMVACHHLDFEKIGTTMAVKGCAVSDGKQFFHEENLNNENRRVLWNGCKPVLVAGINFVPLIRTIRRMVDRSCKQVSVVPRELGSIVVRISQVMSRDERVQILNKLQYCKERPVNFMITAVEAMEHVATKRFSFRKGRKRTEVRFASTPSNSAQLYWDTVHRLADVDEVQCKSDSLSWDRIKFLAKSTLGSHVHLSESLPNLFPQCKDLIDALVKHQRLLASPCTVPLNAPAWLYEVPALDETLHKLRSKSTGIQKFRIGRKIVSGSKARPTTAQHDEFKEPIFVVHGQGGSVEQLEHAASFSKHPVFGIKLEESAPLDSTLQTLARYYVDSIVAICPDGPYRVAGFSLGAAVAYEIVLQLVARGKRVVELWQIDSSPLTLGIEQVGLSRDPKFVSWSFARELLGIEKDDEDVFFANAPNPVSEPKEFAQWVCAHDKQIDVQVAEQTFVWAMKEALIALRYLDEFAVTRPSLPKHIRVKVIRSSEMVSRMKNSVDCPSEWLEDFGLRELSKCEEVSFKTLESTHLQVQNLNIW